MAGPLDDQVDEPAAVNEVIVEQKVVLVLDEWPVHVGHPIDQHQQHAEAGADADHESDDERKADQQVAVLHQERRGSRQHWRRKYGEQIVERLGMTEEADDREFGIENLMRGGVENRPSHRKTEKNDKATLKGHG